MVGILPLEMIEEIARYQRGVDLLNLCRIDKTIFGRISHLLYLDRERYTQYMGPLINIETSILIRSMSESGWGFFNRDKDKLHFSLNTQLRKVDDLLYHLIDKYGGNTSDIFEAYLRTLSKQIGNNKLDWNLIIKYYSDHRTIDIIIRVKEGESHRYLTKDKTCFLPEDYHKFNELVKVLYRYQVEIRQQYPLLQA